MNTRVARIILSATPRTIQTVSASIHLAEPVGDATVLPYKSLKLDVALAEPAGEMSNLPTVLVRIDELAIQEPIGVSTIEPQVTVTVGPIALQEPQGETDLQLPNSVILFVDLDERSSSITVDPDIIIPDVPIDVGIGLTEPHSTVFVSTNTPLRFTINIAWDEPVSVLGSTVHTVQPPPPPADSSLWYRGFISNMGRGMN